MFGRRCKGGMVDQTSGVPEYSVKDAIAIRVTVEHDFQLERRVVARFEHEGGKEDAPERSPNDHVIDLVANARDITQDSPLQTTPPGATSTILLRGKVSGKKSLGEYRCTHVQTKGPGGNPIPFDQVPDIRFRVVEKPDKRPRVTRWEYAD